MNIIPSSPEGMVFFQEDEIIHLEDGEITTQVTAAAYFKPGGEIASIHKITGGTGVYERATGYLLLTGFSDHTGLGATLDYQGEIYLKMRQETE
jgi:hypothetical protein